MTKNIITKAMLSCVAMICFGVQESKAQQESSERELQVVSFKEADTSDFDVTTPSNFEGKLKDMALVKVFMPGEIESTDPVSAQNIKRQQSPGSGLYASYVWIPQHTNSMAIFPKGNTYQKVKVTFKNYDIPVYSIKNKKGGLQAGKVYHLVLRDPAPVYIDTHLKGAYACIDNKTEKIYADNDGRITLRDLAYGEYVVNVFAGDGSSRGSVKIDDRQRIYTLDARKKTKLNIRTNPYGGLISILNGEVEEQYDRNKEYAYGSYKVIAYINGNRVEKNITVDDNNYNKPFTIDNTRTYNITPVYNGAVSATVYENNKRLDAGIDEDVVLEGNTYRITRPIGGSYKYYASNSTGKSKKIRVNVSNNSQSDYQLSIAARNSIVWPWQRDYDAAPVGIAIGYVQKQMITKGEGEKLKENGVWDDGQDKWLSGMQIGILGQPCFSWGLGIYTGLFYEFYLSSNDNYDYTDFQEHNLVVPIHALYRLPFGRKCALSVHGGLGFSYVINGAYKGDGYEDFTDFYGEPAFPKRFNMALEGGIDFRVGPVQIGLLYSKGINDHKSYSSLGNYKTTYNKIGINVAWVIGE